MSAVAAFFKVKQSQMFGFISQSLMYQLAQLSETNPSTKKCHNCGHIDSSAFICILYLFLEVIYDFCGITYGLLAV